jgi:hypothetical protein
MAKGTKANSYLTREKAMAHSNGKMVESMKVNGKTVNNTESEYSRLKIIKSKKENGLMVKR